MCAPRVASWCPCTSFVKTARLPRGSRPQVQSLAWRKGGGLLHRSPQSTLTSRSLDLSSSQWRRSRQWLGSRDTMGCWGHLCGFWKKTFGSPNDISPRAVANSACASLVPKAGLAWLRKQNAIQTEHECLGMVFFRCVPRRTFHALILADHSKTLEI